MDETARKDGKGDRAAADAPGSPPAAARLQAGTGRWVESSWDLCRGLTVQEGLPADAGLDEWLEAMLRG